MTTLRGFLITLASGVAFAVLGGLGGYLLGIFVPDYYRTVFRIPPAVEINPVHAGIGLGVTQGLAAGLFIGLVIVDTVAWFNARVRSGAAVK
jgi:hypothetical protein